jgi:hypothetical protein
MIQAYNSSTLIPFHCKYTDRIHFTSYGFVKKVQFSELSFFSAYIFADIVLYKCGNIHIIYHPVWWQSNVLVRPWLIMHFVTRLKMGFMEMRFSLDTRLPLLWLGTSRFRDRHQKNTPDLPFTHDDRSFKHTSHWSCHCTVLKGFMCESGVSNPQHSSLSSLRVAAYRLWFI